MARKKRDYKAEYRRKVALAKADGYSGPKEKTKARKALGLDRKFRATPPKRYLTPDVLDRLSGSHVARLRREALAWSLAHSWVDASKYSTRMSNAQVEDYHRAYVQRADANLSRRKRALQKRNRIYDYLIKYGFKVEGGRNEEWKSEREPA